MDGDRFDSLTRLVAGSRSRRQLLKLLGAGVLAATGGITRAERGHAAHCPSGVICSARCCPNADDICLAGRCTSCPSGVICSAQCCPHASDLCHAGRCAPAAPACGAVGEACTEHGDCCAPLICRGGVCEEGKGGGDACPPGSRECDGVCYPGGCCADADCGDPCLVCDLTSHACQSCPSGQVCQPGRGCCARDCAGKNCGPDGCGGSCGSCQSGQTCRRGICVGTCTPDCTGQACGPDGCGGMCGTCPTGQTCQHETCVDICTPDCTGQACSDDGCGGMCATCPSGQVCHEGSCCTPATCNPGLPSRRCGTLDDGCGGILECGDSCNAMECEACFEATHYCGWTCDSDQVCDFHTGTCCTPTSCPPTVTCGTRDDGCGGTLDCGDCDPREVCVQLAPDVANCCTPSLCQENQCGSLDNGCGGTLECGPCPAGQTCTAGFCCTPQDPAALCAGRGCETVVNNCGQTIACGRLTCDGCCDDDHHCHAYRVGDEYCATDGTGSACDWCPDDTICGGGGTPNVCAACRPEPRRTTCQDHCGPVLNNCGQRVDCGNPCDRTREICAGAVCCPVLNVCGDTCLSAGCDGHQCQVCDPAQGACVAQTCPAHQHCEGGICVCDNGYSECLTKDGITCTAGECCSGYNNDGVLGCCDRAILDKNGYCCCRQGGPLGDGACVEYPDTSGGCGDT